MTAKTVSLVLGSGGARGLAHIGVIRLLEERGYEIRSISGSSMGALIGGIYATGRLEDYANWVSALEKLDVVRLLDINFASGGLFRGERIIEVLRELIGRHLIEELPISYTAVAADINRQREVWLKTGPLFDAIRASIAIPTLFTPAYSEGRTLLDGGLVNPVPIAPTVRDNTDVTIAVNASAPLSKFGKLHHLDKPTEPDPWYRKHINAFLENLSIKPEPEQPSIDSMEIMNRSFETMQAMITRFQLAANSPDITIDIPTNVCSFYEFYRAEELMTFGYEKAEKVMNELLGSVNQGLP